MPDDFRSTDLQGAAYYARIFDTGFERDIDRPSRIEAENDEIIFALGFDPRDDRPSIGEVENGVVTDDGLEREMGQISDRCRIG